MITQKIWKVRYPFCKDKKVEVYRNLHADLWSVRQDNKVVVHTDKIVLREVKFYVQPAGNARVRREEKKNVHAYVKGYLSSSKEINAIHEELGHDDNHCFDTVTVTYNPYTCNSFVSKENFKPIQECDFLDMDITSMNAKLLAIFTKGTAEEWL